MKENTKFLVTELNKLLDRNYSVIYFNSLSPEELLQVLKEVLIKIQDQNDTNVDIRNGSPEETAIYILSILRVLNYQPQIDPAAFRQGLIRGDPDMIHPILTWLLSRLDIVRKRAYLSRFLVKIEVPDEYLNDPEVSSLYDQYTAAINRFKTVHKEREIGKKNFENASELTADLKTMEKEKEAVTIRIEKMKAKAEPGIHLLDAARALRIEKDKERDLALQEEQEKDILSTLQTSLQRLERELQTLKEDENEITVETLLQHLSEAITVQTIVTNEKLPGEIQTKRDHIKALVAVKQYSYLGPDQITALRNKLDTISEEIQKLIGLKISKSSVDKIEPFRQQAAAVTNIKRNVLERLEKTERSLQELQAKLKEKQELSKFMVEDIIPKGEELKKYINRLKTRGTLYKHCKAELAWLAAENNVLYRTTTILENQVNQCNQAKEIFENVKKTIPDNFTEENAFSMNVQLSRNIFAFRAKLVPLINELQTLRKKSREYDQQQQQAEKTHKNVESSMNISINDLQSEIEGIKLKIEKDVEEIKKLQELVHRMKTTEEKINRDTEDSTISDPGKKLKEELNNVVLSEEAKLKSLMIEKDRLKEFVAVKEKQIQMWNDILSLNGVIMSIAEHDRRNKGICACKILLHLLLR
ncbi:intraflagellar transport protein 81 homolog isoform X2 [Megachile rotundata]|uniref:intraflagellar transport protein 81 homolog isoform X2 n=1 Tax=Megachile rotundata TaxID=143995 RepID=UPI0006153D1C|nr:PREDICTED: intraflagellar transport protein 81 homolog isoform X2 [Megachile rotundata]